MDTKWRDKWGLVRTNDSSGDSGNGFFYSTVALAVNAVSMPEIFENMKACYRYDDALLMRNPANTYGNTSHDDYLALGMMFIFNEQKHEARRLLFRALPRGFYLKNCPFDFDGTWSQWWKQVTAPMLWRFPAWILVMAGAAFTSSLVRYPVRKLLRCVLSFYKHDYENESGLQLQFMSLYALGALGDKEPMKKFMAALPAPLDELMTPYWQPGHDVLLGYRAFYNYVKESV